jgi:hypothetical protein
MYMNIIIELKILVHLYLRHYQILYFLMEKNILIFNARIRHEIFVNFFKRVIIN